MSEKQEPTTSPAPISSAEDSPARTSASPEQGQESKGNVADCGGSLPASLASFDPDTQSWRTSQRSLLGGWIEYSETWPRSGMMLSGTAYPLQPSAPLTAVTGGSALPTPRAQDAKHGQATDWEISRAQGYDLLHTRVARGWPTPTVGDSKSSGSRNTANSKAHAGISLTDAVRGDGGKGRTWPTPLASDGAKDASGSLARIVQTGHAKGRLDGTLRKGQKWPTPTARDWKSGKSSDELFDRNSRPLSEHVERGVESGGRLNPAWVEALMGFPTGWTEVE